MGPVTGAWVRETVGAEVASIPWLAKDSGLAALQLTTSATSTGGVHDVEVAFYGTSHVHDLAALEMKPPMAQPSLHRLRSLGGKHELKVPPSAGRACTRGHGNVVCSMEGSIASAQHGGDGAVQGQLLTREGLTLTEDPEVFQLLGVYVAATGHLHAKVEPASGPMTVALADNETMVHPAAYRSAPDLLQCSAYIGSGL